MLVKGVVSAVVEMLVKLTRILSTLTKIQPLAGAAAETVDCMKLSPPVDARVVKL